MAPNASTWMATGMVLLLGFVVWGSRQPMATPAFLPITQTRLTTHSRPVAYSPGLWPRPPTALYKQVAHLLFIRLLHMLATCMPTLYHWADR